MRAHVFLLLLSELCLLILGTDTDARGMLGTCDPWNIEHDLLETKAVILSMSWHVDALGLGYPLGLSSIDTKLRASKNDIFSSLHFLEVLVFWVGINTSIV